MAVQHGIWKIGDKHQPLATVRLDSESLLEEKITRERQGHPLANKPSQDSSNG